jgi:hypothetical protein
MRFNRWMLVLFVVISGCEASQVTSDLGDSSALFDLSAVVDGSVPPPDLTGVDLWEPPPDLVAGPDLAPPPDLLPPPCGGNCTSAQLCCNNSCIPNDVSNCGACGNVCASGSCGTALSASMTTQPADWQFNGSATWDNVVMSGVLTQNASTQAGSIIYKRALVADAFEVGFDFRITGSGSSGDGMGFVIETDGNDQVGAGGGGLGMTGLHGYGVELDTFNSGCGDDNGNHAAVNQLVPCGGAQPTKIRASTLLNTAIGILSDGDWWHGRVQLINGALTVRIDRNNSNNSPVLAGVSLPGFVSGTPYYFGFVASTGTFTEKHEIRNVTVTFPTKHCL